MRLEKIANKPKANNANEIQQQQQNNDWMNKFIHSPLTWETN